MIDPISRLLAITEIENNIVRHESKETDSELIKAYEAGQRDALESMKMAIERMQGKADWIPIEKRKPKELEFIIATINDDYGNEDVGLITYTEKDSLCHMITAWMPIPKAYKRKVGRKDA